LPAIYSLPFPYVFGLLHRASISYFTCPSFPSIPSTILSSPTRQWPTSIRRPMQITVSTRHTIDIPILFLPNSLTVSWVILHSLSLVLVILPPAMTAPKMSKNPQPQRRRTLSLPQSRRPNLRRPFSLNSMRTYWFVFEVLGKVDATVSLWPQSSRTPRKSSHDPLGSCRRTYHC
jgi:hypothetical protein